MFSLNSMLLNSRAYGLFVGKTILSDQRLNKLYTCLPRKEKIVGSGGDHKKLWGWLLNGIYNCCVCSTTYNFQLCDTLHPVEKIYFEISDQEVTDTTSNESAIHNGASVFNLDNKTNVKAKSVNLNNF